MGTAAAPPSLSVGLDTPASRSGGTLPTCCVFLPPVPERAAARALLRSRPLAAELAGGPPFARAPLTRQRMPVLHAAGCLSCCGKPAKEPTKSNPLRCKRICKDLLCCIIFALFLGLLGFIFGFAISTGDYMSLLYGADYTGNRCGVDQCAYASGTRKCGDKVFYPRLPRDMLEQSDLVATQQYWKLNLYGLCVDSCPTQFDISNPTLISDYGYNRDTAVTQALGSGTQASWISATPTVDLLNRCVPRAEATLATTKMCAYPNCTAASVVAVGGACLTTPSELADFGSAWKVFTPAQRDVCVVEAKQDTTTSFQISASDEQSAAAIKTIAGVVGGIFEVMSSLADNMYFILALGILAPIVFAFCLMVLLYCFAKIVIYGLLISLILLEVIATLICFAKSGMSFGSISADSLIDNALNVTLPDAASSLLAAQGDSKWIYTVGFWVLIIVTLITLITVIASRKKIAICAAIIKEATLVFRSMPMIMLFPTFTSFLQIVVGAWFVFGMVLIQTTKAESFDVALGKLPNATFATSIGGTPVSVGSEDPIASLRELSESGNLKTAFTLIHLYGFFVLYQWVGGICWCTISAAVGWWYYFKDDKANHYRFPIIRALGIITLFHTGSVAFAAFVLAFFDLLRAICAYVQKHMAAAAGKNLMVKLVFYAINCLLYCIQKTVKLVSYYGLVFVATNGNSFCGACARTAGFFVSNMAQVSINQLVIFLLRMSTLLTVPLGCAIAGFLVGQQQGTDNPGYPAGVIYIGSFLMTGACMSLFECVITTIFVCTFEDKGVYGGKYLEGHPILAKVFDVDIKKNKLEKYKKQVETEEANKLVTA